jgi:hypothetical protein
MHHPLQGNQTKTSVTFGCGYLNESTMCIWTGELRLPLSRAGASEDPVCLAGHSSLATPLPAE